MTDPRINLKSAYRNVEGESPGERARRVTREASRMRRYRQMQKRGRGASKPALMERIGELLDARHSDNYDEVSRKARRVAREADKLRARRDAYAEGCRLVVDGLATRGPR